MPRMRWRPRWGAHDAPPDPLVGWGGGHPLPKNATPLGAFGTSISSVYTHLYF